MCAVQLKKIKSFVSKSINISQSLISHDVAMRKKKKKTRIKIKSQFFKKKIQINGLRIETNNQI